MIIVMAPIATEEQVKHVIETLVRRGLDVHRSTGSQRVVLGVVGDTMQLDPREFELMDGVHEALRVTDPFKLVGRTFHNENTVVDLGDGVTIGGREVAVMAGPCAIETLEITRATARSVARAGAKILRGGAYKPRTSPYAWQGLGERGLTILQEAASEFGLKSVTEVMDPRNVELVSRHTDMLQIGTRNMQNFDLLREVGRASKPVLLKRGLSATIQEWLLSAEYIYLEGNRNVVLCERGIRTYEPMTRNTLDLSAVPLLKRICHLPVVVDPSHGTGRRDQVAPMARAAVAAGADGLLIDVHPEPERALVDGPQALLPEDFAMLMGELRIIAPAVGRTIPTSTAERGRS
jgi:3-deoxy-7-phosphoheptulonate synthase